MVEYDFVKVPIVDIVNQIILYAAQHRASDIHFDPLEDALMIRMRIDGALQNHSLVPKIYERNLITRIKLVAAMNITETRLPQDGAIKGRIGNKDLDMRVSILPTNEGEKCVIRLLDFQVGLNGLDSLGFTPENYVKVEKMLNIPNGIILVTGATGSGKSTTTYSMLQALNKEETNIITVEDPIEMNIEGVNQVQVNSEIGMTFAAALRSILRQDPNIILIGEMRDEETAQIAVRASITGHLVLSTIHTNNALATIERLIDMGVERYMLATSVTGIISQRLARTVCTKCRKLRTTTKFERYMFAKVLNKKVKETYQAVGCSECHNGYTGRVALHEVLYISEHLRDLISDENIDKEELRNEVYGAADTKTLLQDALEKVILGYTTFEEVYRVVDIDVDLENAIKSQMGVKEKDKVSMEGSMLINGIDEVDWNTFDGIFEDEVEVIDIDKEDDNDLPTLDRSVINVRVLRNDFNKTLEDSDEDFIKFFLDENKKIKDEDTEERRKKLLEEKELRDRQKELEDDLIDDFDLIDINEDDDKIVPPMNPYRSYFEGIKDDDVVVLEENTNNTAINNRISGYSDSVPKKQVLNLDNVEFNYKNLLDLIDAYSTDTDTIQEVINNNDKIDSYSNDGPTIEDIVNAEIKTKKAKRNKSQKKIKKD